MSILSDILGGISSLAAGGVTGLVGTALSSIYAYKGKQLDIEMQKLKFDNDLAMTKANAEIAAQEWAARTQVAATEGAAAVDLEEAKGFTASLTSEPQRYATGVLTPAQNWCMVILDLFKGIVRPGLTAYLVVLTTLIYWQARSLIGAGMSAADAVSLTSRIVDTVLYLTSTVVLWWFGSRVHSKKPA